MQARGPLMIEHRLIERMLDVIDNVIKEIKSTNKVDPLFIDAAVDFIRVYADKTHHGKEEDILFRELKNKPLSSGDRILMDDLIKEHIFGRLATMALVQANDRCRNGDDRALEDISSKLKTLIEFYPKHIKKEDKVFFPASRKYFSEEEDQAILAEFWEFDRKMIHEKYTSFVEGFEKKK
jgi:hemerythrin-like domain-containing protein